MGGSRTQFRLKSDIFHLSSSKPVFTDDGIIGTDRDKQDLSDVKLDFNNAFVVGRKA